jgi:hypothetical protein
MMPKECIVQKSEINDLIEDDFAAVLSAVADQCEQFSNDIGTVLGHPELGEALLRVARAVHHLQAVELEVLS